MKSVPPGDAQISPMAARIRQVLPASEARKTHFSHISCRISVLACALNRAPSIRVRNRLYPVRQRAILFTERQLVGVVEVHDLAIGERGCDQALASQHALATESLVQNFQVAHAVEQRQNDGVRSNCRRE